MSVHAHSFAPRVRARSLSGRDERNGQRQGPDHQPHSATSAMHRERGSGTRAEKQHTSGSLARSTLALCNGSASDHSHTTLETYKVARTWPLRGPVVTALYSFWWRSGKAGASMERPRSVTVSMSDEH